MTLALDKSANQSVQVAFLLIETMAEIGEPVSVSDLARRLGIEKVRAFRYLRTLVSLGYAVQEPETERYRLSLKLYHLAQALADSTVLLREARPILLALRDATGFTVTLSQVEAEGMRILDMVRTAHPVEIVTRPGAMLDFHASAQGKVALAFAGEAGLRRLRGPLREWTPQTQTDPEALAAELAEVRARGWADAPGQVLPGVNALSCPVFDMGGRIAATVTLAGPTSLLRSPPEAAVLKRLKAAAAALSEILGYAGEKA